jgi:hypothetical protein
MDRSTRDKFTSSESGLWETAPRLYHDLVARFGPFDLDLTADPKRHLQDDWLGPGSSIQEDALQGGWSNVMLRSGMRARSGYSNPVYGPFVQRFLPICADEAERDFRSTLLLPMRVTKAFKDWVMGHASHVLLCDKRLVFFENGVPRINYDKRGVPHASPSLFDSMIVIFAPREPGERITPTFEMYNVPPHVTDHDVERAHQAMQIAQAATQARVEEQGLSMVLADDNSEA